MGVTWELKDGYLELRHTKDDKWKENATVVLRKLGCQTSDTPFTQNQKGEENISDNEQLIRQIEYIPNQLENAKFSIFGICH